MPTYWKENSEKTVNVFVRNCYFTALPIGLRSNDTSNDLINNQSNWYHLIRILHWKSNSMIGRRRVRECNWARVTTWHKNEIPTPCVTQVHHPYRTRADAELPIRANGTWADRPPRTAKCSVRFTESTDKQDAGDTRHTGSGGTIISYWKKLAWKSFRENGEEGPEPAGDTRLAPVK